MTSTHDRIQDVTEFGFTERQARFLVLVMRHAGVCVPRQYARFAGVAQGAKCNAFFDKLVRRGYAHAVECIHNRARLYHVHSKPLYHVIGEVRSRYRRPASPRLVIERLMLLDAVLTAPDLEWLTTAAEKADHLARLTASTAAPVEHTASSEPEPKPVVELPGTFPIGVEPDGRTVLLYLATEVWTEAFRTFVQDHARLLRVAPRWTLRIGFPRPLDRVYDARRWSVRNWSRRCILRPSASSSGTSSTATRRPANPCIRRTRDSYHPEFVAEIVDSFPVCYPLTELSVIRHEPDNRFLECALAADAEFIVTVNTAPGHFDRKHIKR